MSHEEQMQEKAVTINRLRFNLSLWQIISLVGFVATVVISFFHYDNSNKAEYATKADVRVLSEKIDRVLTQQSTLAYTVRDNHQRDSTNAIEIKATVVTNKSTTDQELAYIKNLCEKKLGFYQEHWNKDHSKLSVTEN